MARVVLVVPCYNEASRLPADEFVRFRLAQDELRVLFVDDGSTDATREVLAELCARDPARLELLAGAAANSQLLVACVHSRVVEMLWAEGGVTPSQISVDEVVA